MTTTVEANNSKYTTLKALSQAAALQQAVLINNPYIDEELIELISKGTKAITRGVGKTSSELYFQPTKPFKIITETTANLKDILLTILLPLTRTTNKSTITLQATPDIDIYRELVLPFFAPYITYSFTQLDNNITLSLQGLHRQVKKTTNREVLIAIRGVIQGENTDRIQSILDLTLKDLHVPVKLSQRIDKKVRILLVGLFGDHEGYDPNRPLVCGDIFELASESEIPAIISKFKELLKLKEIPNQAQEFLEELYNLPQEETILSIDDL